MAPWYEPTETRELQLIEDGYFTKEELEYAKRLLRWGRQLPDNPVPHRQFLQEEMS